MNSAAGRPAIRRRGRGALCGLAAAALFGASAPLSKRLLPALSPLVLAGLLYLGAGLGLALARLLAAAGGEAAARRRCAGHGRGAARWRPSWSSAAW